MKTPRINKLLVGEALVGEGSEVAHIDLLIGPRAPRADGLPLGRLLQTRQERRLLLARTSSYDHVAH